MYKWFRLGDGVHKLDKAIQGKVTLTIAGTGSVQLGVEGPEGAFVPYTDSGAVLNGEGSAIVCNCGKHTQLMAQVSGAGADFALGFGPEEY